MKKRNSQPEVDTSNVSSRSSKLSRSRTTSSVNQSWNTTLKAVSIMVPTQLMHLGLEIPPANSFPSEFVMKKGYLMKLESRRPLSKFWQKKFCVLAKNKIYFYKNERSTGVEKSSSSIDLNDYSRCQRNSETKGDQLFENNLNEFAIHPTRKTIFGKNSITLASEDLMEAEEWIIQIQKAIYSLHCQDSLSDKKIEQSHHVKDCKPTSEGKPECFPEHQSESQYHEYSSLKSQRAPSSVNNLIEGTLERSSTCGKPFQKGFEANRESIYSQTKAKHSTKDLTYAYSSSSSNDGSDDSFSPSMIVVNETRPTPKSHRASFIGAQLPQNNITPSYLGSQVSQNNATTSVIGAQLPQNNITSSYLGSQVSQNNATTSVIGAQLSPIGSNKLTLVQHTESPIMRRPHLLNNSSNSRMWSPARAQPPPRPPHAQVEHEDDQFLQTLSEDDLREVTPAESIAEGSELNESFIFHSKNNGKLDHRLPQKGSSQMESNVATLTSEVSQLKVMTQRLEQDLLGAKNDVGNVQESLAQVQASAETIAERVDRFANQMRQLERQASNLINELKVKSDQLDQKLSALDLLQTNSNTSTMNNALPISSDVNANKNISTFGNMDSSLSFGTNPNWPCFRFGEGTSVSNITSSSGSQTFPKNKQIYSQPTRKSDPASSSFLFPSPDSTLSSSQTRKNLARHSVQICQKTTQDPQHGNFGLACSTNQNQGLTCSTNQNQRLTCSTNKEQADSKPRFAITPSTMAQVVSLNQNNHLGQKPK